MGSQGGFGGTIFTQDANNGAIYSSNGHTYNIQGPSGGSIQVARDENGHAYYVDYNVDEGDELLGEFPQDIDEEAYDDQLYGDENLDSDGEPIPSPDEIKDIINSIPSYKFEEAADGYESAMSMAQKSSKKSTANSKGASAAAS